MAMGDTAQSSEMCYDVEPGTGSLSMDDANDIDEDSDGDRYLPEAQQGDREGEDTSTANTAGGPSRNPQQSASGPDTDQHYHHQVQQQKQRPDKVPRESELQNLTTTPAEAQTTADGDPISVSGAGLLISQATSEALISAGAPLLSPFSVWACYSFREPRPNNSLAGRNVSELLMLLH